MTPPCDICLEPKCLAVGGPGSCDCAACAKRDVCPRQLRPTVRITTRCTQSCAHCCFACGPKRTEMMSVGTARDVARFVRANGVRRLNVMGGEFLCNPHWEEILEILAETVEPLAMRLVTNGDWAGGAKTRRRVVDFIKAHGSIYMALSHDKWHTNRHIAAAERALAKAGIVHFRATKEEGDSPPVPAGRAEFGAAADSSYGFMGCYCFAPDRKYHFLIDEEGLISKCPVGIWTYDRIGHYLDGGFRDRFKQFHGVFHKSFVGSCHRCVTQWQFAKNEMLKNARE